MGSSRAHPNMSSIDASATVSSCQVFGRGRGTSCGRSRWPGAQRATQQLSRWNATARWSPLCGPAGPSSADEARSGKLPADEAHPGELPADEARLGELSAEGVRQGELSGLLVASAAPRVHLASPADADRADGVRPGELSASLLALLLLLTAGPP